jgi:hypothetical protein
MPTRTTAALLLAAGLALGGCSTSSSSADPERTGYFSSSPLPTTAPAYNPAVWKTRITNLVTVMDQSQNECTVSPSSDACNEVLRAADTQMLQMKQDVDADGGAASHPQTADILNKILGGYNAYIANNCPGNDLADDEGSDCRVSMVTVLLGVATLPSKMVLDGDQ